MTAILAAGGYANNAELIVACRDLGYLDDHTPTWDGTYRHGRFWTLWQPQHLHRTDLDPAHSPDHPGDWGPYEPAIRRWEALTRPAPSPVDERGRLNPELPEWMMGFDAGWITDHLTRTAALKAAGNAVCPQQATAAFGLLIGGKP